MVDAIGLDAHTRAGKDLFYGTFEDRPQAEPCEPCAEAVLDAAGK